MLCFPSLALQEGAKVKYNHTKRAAYIYIYIYIYSYKSHLWWTVYNAASLGGHNCIIVICGDNWYILCVITHETLCNHFLQKVEQIHKHTLKQTYICPLSAKVKNFRTNPTISGHLCHMASISGHVELCHLVAT